MVYLYLSDECEAEDHDSCAGERDMPKDPEVCGGGICTCDCHVTIVEVNRPTAQG